MELNAKIPLGPLEDKWSVYKRNAKLVNPANRKKLDVIVIGAGLAGSSVAASLGELGYNVKSFCFQDTPRRAHSVAAQGGVNAAKNYKNDGDSIYRMFVDTIKGGDFRAREANVYRMAECSVNLIDQAVAQGVPFGREYGGYLNNRSFGGVQVSRTFYSRGQTGQQLLLGAYQALMRQVGKGTVKLFARHEMLDVVLIEGKARGVIVRNLDTGDIERHAAHAVALATGGYGKIYYLSTLAMGCNGSAIWRAHKKGALMASPSWIQIHPTSLPQSGSYQSKLTLMSESLRNDGRIWVPLKKDDTRTPNNIPEQERDYYLERKYPSFGNLAPRDISSRAAKERIDAGYGIGPLKNAVYLDFSKAIHEQGKEKIKEKYGNLFDMYRKITGYDAYKEPMMISPSAHFSMGGLWVDYELMTSIPGLFALGEANFADHGANRLGANSLLQASVDGYFIAPYTIANYLAAEVNTGKISPQDPAFPEAEKQVGEQIAQLLAIKGNRTVDDYHRALGKILYDYCGLVRNEEGLQHAIVEIRKLRDDFYRNVKVSGAAQQMNAELEKAGRVADYLEIGELMCHDALIRKESCGAHFREEYQTPDGEALRNDAEYRFISAWQWNGPDGPPILHKEHRYLKQLNRLYEVTNEELMKIRLKIWRQENPAAKGRLVDYTVDNVNIHMSFLEMLDLLNQKLILSGNDPVEFDHDCREGICGQCGLMINGIAHGPLKNTTTCQLHMREFKDGETIVIEPFRTAAFSVRKDLKVDRSAFDRIISSGGFISVNTGQAPEANSTRITHHLTEAAFDSAACIGCGACVATCKNGSAALFTSAKITQLALLPQGDAERIDRVLAMISQTDSEHFGHCSNTEACQIECPQNISVLNIARMNYEYNRAILLNKI